MKKGFLSDSIASLLHSRPTLSRTIMVFSGVGLGQIVTVLASPILTRVYAPSALGELALYTAIAAVFAQTACLRYDLAIAIAPNIKIAITMTAICLLVGAVIATIVSIIVGVVGIFLPALLQDVRLVSTVPIFILLSAVFLALNQLHSRIGRFRMIAASPILKQTSTTSIQIGFGLAGYGANLLIIAVVVGQAAASAAFFTSNRLTRALWGRVKRFSDWRRYFRTASRYNQFPRYAAPQELLNAASQQMPVLALALAFGAEAAGFYWITVRVLQAPVGLIGQSARLVLFQRFADGLRKTGSIYAVHLVSTMALAAIGVIVFFPIFLFGPQLFDFAFGPDWRIAGTYGKIVALWTLMMLVNVPSTSALVAMEKQGLLLGYEVIIAIARLAAILFSFNARDPIYLVAGFAGVSAIGNVVLIWISFVFVNKHHRGLS